jgi:hypothetical protein
MNTAGPLSATVLAASVAVLMVYAGIGKRMLDWRVAAERRLRRRRPGHRRGGKRMCSRRPKPALRPLARRGRR